MTAFTESVVEQAALDWLRALDWGIAHGPEIAPDQPAAERAHYGQVILEGRLRTALAQLNSQLPAEALDDACRRLLHPRARRSSSATAPSIGCSSTASRSSTSGPTAASPAHRCG